MKIGKLMNSLEYVYKKKPINKLSFKKIALHRKNSKN